MPALSRFVCNSNDAAQRWTDGAEFPSRTEQNASFKLHRAYSKANVVRISVFFGTCSLGVGIISVCMVH